MTRNPPAYGEPERTREGWLGSVRWAALLDQLRELRHNDDGVTRMWRALLRILDEQGDLGMTGIDPEAVQAWAHYTQGRNQLVRLLDELAPSVIEIVRDALAEHSGLTVAEDRARLAKRGKREHSVVFPHKDAVHLRIAIPAAGRGERLRIQFAADGGAGPRFSVEARHGNAAKLPQHVQANLRRIAEQLRAAWALDDASQLSDFRTYWAHGRPPQEWLGEGHHDVVERLYRFIRDDVETLVGSGLFSEDKGLCHRDAHVDEPAAEQEPEPADTE